MDSRQNGYFGNLLNGGLNLDDEVSMESLDQITFNNVNQHAQVLTHESQPSAQTGITSKKSQRGGNFTNEEDILLTSAWLCITLDAVQGNEQKSKTYWKRVWEYFHEEKKFVSNRNENSLMNRWSIIQLSVNKFCGCYAQIESRNQSGVNEDDKIAQAKTLYSENHQCVFQLDHCWRKLRYQPKWLLDLEKKKSKKKTFTAPSPSNPELVNLGEDDFANDAFVNSLERPAGRKAEKLERSNKRKCTEISASPLVGILTDIKADKKKASEKKMDILQQVFAQEQERIQHDKEKISIKQAMLRVKQLREEERIMTMDTTGLPQMQRQYYESRQREIVQLREKGI